MSHDIISQSLPLRGSSGIRIPHRLRIAWRNSGGISRIVTRIIEWSATLCGRHLNGTLNVDDSCTNHDIEDRVWLAVIGQLEFTTAVGQQWIDWNEVSPS